MENKIDRKMMEGHGVHHPFCKWTYEEGNWTDYWVCHCEILKAYDKWRAKCKRK